MTPRRITPRTTLDNLKKEAKRWLKALRDGDAAARVRFVAAHPLPPARPTLRSVQLALAREYGFRRWEALAAAVGAMPEQGDRDGLVARFLEYACPDHHVRGRPAHRIARHAAMRLLEQHPEIAKHDLYTAVVCGEVEEVRRILENEPELATAKRSAAGADRSGVGGSMDFLEDPGAKNWEPLLFLAFTRLPLPAVDENAVAIARELLDRGADPNALFRAGDSRYTPLTGVIGEGEEDRPAHPRRDELTRLLMERGANPYDSQVVYNLHFHATSVLWYLKLAYEFSVNAGHEADWDDPNWSMLDPDRARRYGSGARWHLRTAILNDDRELAAWCLVHGASPNVEPETGKQFNKRTLYENAVLRGRTEIAKLLVEHGAVVTPVVLEGEEAFVAACMRRDEAEVARLLAEHPEYLRSYKAIFEAAQNDRADVVADLLDRGVPIEIEDENKRRPLHVAAYSHALRVAELLIARGAEIDPVENEWHNTPLDFAVYTEDEEMTRLLSRYSRDVWNLTFTGDLPRLREVLGAEPELARIGSQTTPLFWLPEDEATAIEIARLFLDFGADPSIRNPQDGTTAADIARKRGMDAVADLLEAAARAAEARSSE